MVHELSKRPDALWRYDQYIANAQKKPELQEFRRTVKSREQDNINIKKLKQLIGGEIKRGCF